MRPLPKGRGRVFYPMETAKFSPPRCEGENFYICTVRASGRSSASCAASRTILFSAARRMHESAISRFPASSPVKGSSSASASQGASSARASARRRFMPPENSHTGWDRAFCKQPCRFLPVVCRAEREAEVSRSVQVLEQAVLLKDRRPAEILRCGRAAVRPLQPQQDAQQRRFPDARVSRNARQADGRGKGQAVQHRPAVIGLFEICYDKLHHAPTLSVRLSTARRNSFSKPTDSSTMTAVHAKRSGVWKYTFAV